MEKYYLMWISNGAFQTDKIGEYTSKSKRFINHPAA